jgi:hypothetical protein
MQAAQLRLAAAISGFRPIYSNQSSGRGAMFFVSKIGMKLLMLEPDADSDIQNIANSLVIVVFYVELNLI